MKPKFILSHIRLAKLSAILLALFLGFTNLALAVKYPTEGLTTEKVNVRKKANLSSIIEGRLEQGTVITLLGMTGNFYQIKHESLTGYIHKDYVQIGTEPTPTPEPEKYSTLNTGSKGPAVLALQEALTELKFYTGELDGSYGKSTKDAVSAFQKRNKIKVDGKAGDQVQKLLYDATPRNSKGNAQKVKTLPPLPGMVMRYGSRGQAVADLQQRLKELNYYTGEITRSYDMRTRNAISRFQTKNGIKKSPGDATAETQAMLYSQLAIPADVKITPTPTPLPAAPTEKLVRGKTGKQVTNLQNVLAAYGYYEGKANGKYDDKTIAAVTAFQKKNELTADGVAGETTVALLFSDKAIKQDGTLVKEVVLQATPAPKTIYYPEINSSTRSLTVGSTGEDVLTLQRRLTELGYYSARNDGKFQSDDRAAVIAFQRRNGLSPDGIADSNTLLKLYSVDAARYSSTSFTTDINQNNAQPLPIQISLRLGDSGDAVKTLQERLIALKYLSGIADGTYGRATKKAVTDFQRANKLTADGIAGAATQALLYSKSALENSNTRGIAGVLKRGDKNASVQALQEILIRLGYLKGEADGKFGVNTQLALIHFQNRNNLKADGIAGLQTLEALKSDNIKLAPGAAPTPKPTAPPISLIPNAKQVQYEYWYTHLRPLTRRYPNVTIYDYINGISWQVKIFSTGTHADAVPVTAQDTANMNHAFGGRQTWTPKAVWVQFSDGSVYMATTHNVPHGTSSGNEVNSFAGHLCIHFPRTLPQVQAIGPYATAHQNAVEVGWQQTQILQKQ